MKISTLETIKSKNKNKWTAAGAAALLGFLALASQQQAGEQIISVGNITCNGADPVQIEQNTPVANVASWHEVKIGLTELTDEQQRDLRTIVIKRIIDAETESVLSEKPTDNGNTELVVNQTITANLPAKCVVYNYPF